MSDGCCLDTARAGYELMAHSKFASSEGSTAAREPLLYQHPHDSIYDVLPHISGLSCDSTPSRQGSLGFLPFCSVNRHRVVLLDTSGVVARMKDARQLHYVQTVLYSFPATNNKAPEDPARAPPSRVFALRFLSVPRAAP
ncbi:hypothetical protein NDU88_006309 [Pleurodeles waltl]|uniref:Uncharacterized protein n=1 Tax=Pleurodeles waltl TaxID=8319 RepID=A0AAV7MFH4_PLEWA|nr:hypothetical protein NDU88_006309 [Pleurodeles waltl]